MFCFLASMAQPDRSDLSLNGQNGWELTCSIQDSEGYWWYGGRGTGLCRFDGYETEIFRSDRQNPDLLRSNDLLCIAEQKNGTEIWFGTKEGAYILSKHDYSISPIILKTAEEDNELADKRISCLLPVDDGSMWLTYRNQLLHFSAQAELLERFETMWEGKNRSVLSLSYDADSTLWIGLWNAGVVRMRNEHGRWKMEEGQWSDYPANLQEHISAEEQKHVLDSVMTKQAPTNDATILSWVQLPSSQFYIGTYHSLYRYDGQQLTLLEGDLDKLRSMAYSERSQVLYLLSKARGICQWKDGRLTTLLDSTQFRHLQLQGDTALLLSEGVGKNMLFHLQSQQLTADTTTADLCPIVTAYSTDGKKQLMSIRQKSLELPKQTYLVEVYLSTLDFDHALQVQFAYRLNENEAWTELPEGEHIVKLSRLPVGANHLQVRATDYLGRWCMPTTVLTLIRPARWYESVWLWCVLAVVFFTAVYFLLKRREKKESEETVDVVEVHQEEQPQETVEEESNKLSVADQEFLDKASAAVADHIMDSNYSVDALASDLCMSRANLHRKLRAITGQTPTDFIRNQRLERAAQLLRTTSYSVNEIADLVGFSYASYFTKCFKEKYGVLPKDY
ncbi:MAG: helix-turn-helix domain-containing protein [Bacteroidaceae bacterium]|nr:helix-turn-helix domain-containing protein [Bacteroidaceae bacterium]